MVRLLLLLPFLVTLAAARLPAAGKDVSYPVDGEPFKGYFAAAEDAKGLVLLIHDWDGLTDDERQRADLLAESGPDTLSEAGPWRAGDFLVPAVLYRERQPVAAAPLAFSEETR